MTDRVKGFTVTLRADMRDDDAEPIINAIRMIKGVMDVSPVLSLSGEDMIKMRLQREIWDKLYDFMQKELRS